MNSIANLNISVERELELERHGFRRTRRWIGDASQVSDPKWYQASARKVAENGRNSAKVSRVLESRPRREARRPLSPRMRPQTACSEC